MYKADLEWSHKEVKRGAGRENVAERKAHAFIRVHGWSALGFPG